MSSKKTLTGEHVVEAAKHIGLSTTAAALAARLATTTHPEATSRSVATAARIPLKDGRLTGHYHHGKFLYRFVRRSITPRKKVPA